MVKPRHLTVLAVAVSLTGCGATVTRTVTVQHATPACHAGEVRTPDGSCLPVKPTPETAVADSEALHLRSVPSSAPSTAFGVQHISDHGVRFVADFEGFSSCPYWDAYGSVATRGYGETDFGDTFGHRCISRSFAIGNLRRLLDQNYCSAVRRIGGGYTQNQFDAMCSASYNLGPGIIYRLAGSFRAHNCGPLLGYDHAGGVRLYGLTRRRRAECALFYSGHQPPPAHHVTHAEKVKRLHALQRARDRDRAFITRHDCRVGRGHHARPRRTARERRYWRRECNATLRKGQRHNAEIKRLRRERIS
jgi:GH24 family phage-related lysozyme (muramidase)